MNGRKRTRIVLGGLLVVASACKDDGAESTPEAAAPSAPAVPSVEGSAAGPAEDEVAPAPEPPPSGQAVAKVGALLFSSSTGDVGFELPPMGEGSLDAPGMTVNVVGEQDGRVVVETLVAQPAEHYCAATLDNLSDFRLRLFVERDDLVPVVTEDFEQEHEDGTKVRLSRGVAVPKGSTELQVRGTAVRVSVPEDRIGRFYEPGAPLGQGDQAGELPPLESHPLTVGGNPLDESQLFHRDAALAHFGSTPRAAGGALVTVRNPCLEITAIASQDRLDALPTPSSGGLYAMKPSSGAGVLGKLDEGSFLASPYGGAFAGSDDEDVWGGLTGSGTGLGEAYGVGGLGLVGTGRGRGMPTYELKAGTAILWADGSPAGQVIADHELTTEPRDEGGRTCFDIALAGTKGPSVTLCFASGDVGKREPVAVAGVGGIGLGSGLGSSGLGSRGTGTGGSGSTGTGFGGRGHKVPTVRASTAAVTGSLDKDIIRRIVRAHINEVRYCYNQGLVKDPTLSGKVSISFTVAGNGSIAASTVADDSLSDEAVGKCIAKAVKRWKFPKPTGGGVVLVKYPFVLEPG